MSGSVSLQHLAQAQHERLLALSHGQRNDWLGGIRQAGMAALGDQALPSGKDEAWKYTHVSPLLDRALAPASEYALSDSDTAQIQAFKDDVGASRTLVFVDGHHRAALSSTSQEAQGSQSGQAATPAGQPLLAALSNLPSHEQAEIAQRINGVAPTDHRFVALNTSLLVDGPLVRIPAGGDVPGVIHILHVASGDPSAAVYPRTVLHVQQDARATVLETFVSLTDGSYLHSPVCEVWVDAGAKLTHLRQQDEALSASHVGVVAVRVARDGHYEQMHLSVGGQMVRHEVHVQLQEPGAGCELLGVYLARDKQHVDNHLSVAHMVPNCNSAQTYKGVLDDHATGIFSGRVFVAKNAQGTSARQLNRHLVLSKGATANSRPILEILADDVKCSHGATVGQLDEDALFYLRSRGIDDAEARRLLTQAFAADVFDRIDDENIRARFSERAQRWLFGAR